MCRVLLSINPEYVEKIFSGEKEFEFRKNRCKSDVNKMVIYCTSPVMKVIGEADIVEIIEDTPAAVWRKTMKKAGVSKDFYDSYYSGRSKSVAYTSPLAQEHFTDQVWENAIVTFWEKNLSIHEH